MKNVYRIALLAALLAAPVPALAQAGQPPAGRSPAAMQARMAVGPLQQLLEKRAELGLSGEQVERLEQIRDRMEEKNRPLLEQLRAARPSGGQRPRDLTPEQREEMREQMEQLRPVMQQVRENHRAALQEAREVLTPEQQQKARDLMRERRAEFRRDHPRGGRDMPGRPGPRSGNR